MKGRKHILSTKVGRLLRPAGYASVPLPAAALQFPMAHPAVASIIPGIGRASHLEQTLNWFGFEIPAQFWSALIDQGLLRDDAPVPGTC